MKRLLIVSLLAVALTLTAAHPGKPYKIYKNQRAREAASDTGTVAAPPNSSGKISTLKSQMQVHSASLDAIHRVQNVKTLLVTNNNIVCFTQFSFACD